MTVRDGSRLDALAGLDVEPGRADVLRSPRRSGGRCAASTACSTSPGRPTWRLAGPQVFALNVEGRGSCSRRRCGPGVERVVYTSSVGGHRARPARRERRREQRLGRRAATRSRTSTPSTRPRSAALRLIARGLPAGDREPGPRVRSPATRDVVDGAGAALHATPDPGLRRRDAERGRGRGRGPRPSARRRARRGRRALHPRQPQLHVGPAVRRPGPAVGVEPPAVKLPLNVALALSATGNRIAGTAVPTPAEVRAASLNWAFVNRKAKRELGGRPRRTRIVWRRRSPGTASETAPDRARRGSPAARAEAGRRGALRRLGV